MFIFSSLLGRYFFIIILFKYLCLFNILFCLICSTLVGSLSIHIFIFIHIYILLIFFFLHTLRLVTLSLQVIDGGNTIRRHQRGVYARFRSRGDLGLSDEEPEGEEQPQDIFEDQNQTLRKWRRMSLRRTGMMSRILAPRRY